MTTEHDVAFSGTHVQQMYQAIPEELQQLLEGHYHALLSAPSMRKAPFPAHRNRGVSIRVENEAVSVSVHAARSNGFVEVIDVTIRTHDNLQEEDYRVQQAVDCQYCGAVAGEPCRNPDGHKLTYAGDRKLRRRTHHARRELYLTGTVSVKKNGPVKQALPLSSAYIAEQLLEKKQGNDWDKLIADFRKMYSSPELADGLIWGAMKVIERHHPGKFWGRTEFWNFLCTSVSGPHDQTVTLVSRFLVTAYRSKQITTAQFEDFRRRGMQGYTEYAGIDFAPHPMGGLVAVRGLKEI